MINDRDRAAIRASVAAMDIAAWRPLDDAERDLLRRALAPDPQLDRGAEADLPRAS